MSERDVERLNEHLRRYYPSAVGPEAITGFQHQTHAEAARMERRGEIRIIDRRPTRNGISTVYYVRLKTRRQVRAERLARWSPAIFGALALIGFVAYALWSIRALLAEVGLAIVITAAVLWLAPHWRSGCPGIHCNDCGAR